LDVKCFPQLVNNEEVYYSTTITKFNDDGYRQERNLVLTEQAIYNFKSKTIKRRVQYEKLDAITRSTNSSEFVFHIRNENDYRFSSYTRRNEIIETVLFILCRVRKLAQAFKIYEVDLINLNTVMTTHKMQKLNQFRRPNENNAKIIDLEGFAQEKLKESEIKTMARKSTNMIYNAKKAQNVFVCLDDFDLLRRLGKGAFGEVILAQHKESSKLYAIKVLRKLDIIELGQLEHTKTEQKILTHVNHPFLVGLDFAFQTESRLYFVMEFMKGGELYTLLRRHKRLSEAQAKFYAACVTMGLGHLHNSNFIYRDLKLENILLDDSGYAKLIDFGLAKFIANDKKALTFCGTPEYLSPEVILGKGHNRATDWWSLGVLIYEMVFGLPPFYSQKQNEMFKKIVCDDFVFRSDVAASLPCKDFIKRLLDKNQTTRLGSQMDSMEILSHPWFFDIDISMLLLKRIVAPFIPEVKNNQWEKNFDNETMNEELNVGEDDSSRVDLSGLANLQKEFEEMNFIKK
jgi:serum/glucocorticoid-regulated kinase 2